VGAEADGGFGAEDLAEEVLEGAFEVGEGDVLIHVEAFELVEDGEVGGVDLVAAIGGTGGDDADGEFFDRLHGADLHAGGVGAEKAAVVEVEGVALVAGGVVSGGVEGVEAVPFGLDLGAFSEGEAHAAESGDGEVADLREGVEGAGALAGATGQGEIESGDGGGILAAWKAAFLESMPSVMAVRTSLSLAPTSFLRSGGTSFMPALRAVSLPFLPR
jgi:hypothetical protein